MISVALDPEPGILGIAISFAPEDKPIAKFYPMHGRQAANLPLIMENSLGERGAKISDVTYWTVGSGPGSFTFLRLVASVVAGWSFGKTNVHTRTVPGAVGIASAVAGNTSGRGGVLYDGRNHEVLYFGINFVNGMAIPNGENAILNREKATEFFSKRHSETLVALVAEHEAVTSIIPQNIKIITSTPDPVALLTAQYADFNNDLTDLVYIRPAVVSK